MPEANETIQVIPQGVTRRQFIELSATTAWIAGVGGCDLSWGAQAAAAKNAKAAETGPGGMPYRTLGHTGEKVSLVGIGGSHVGTQHDEQESAVQMPLNVMDVTTRASRRRSCRSPSCTTWACSA